jgi:hypothetical protein
MAIGGPVLVRLSSIPKANALEKGLCSDTVDSVYCVTTEPLFPAACYPLRAQTHKSEVVIVDDVVERQFLRKLLDYTAWY